MGWTSTRHEDASEYYLNFLVRPSAILDRAEQQQKIPNFNFIKQFYEGTMRTLCSICKFEKFVSLIIIIVKKIIIFTLKIIIFIITITSMTIYIIKKYC